MRRAILVVKREIADLAEVVDEVEAVFRDSGMSVVRIIDSETQAGDDDFVMAFGGDGTLLRAFHLTGGAAPLIGVKNGTYGLLMELELEEATGAARQIVNGDFIVEGAPTVVVPGEKRGAVNEVLLLNIQRGKASKFSVEVDGTEVNRFISDGVIVSTPLGSMAYALSAGGPILDPRIRAMIVAPLAPWPPSMEVPAGALVVPSNSSVRIKSSKPLVAVIDGQIEIPAGEEIDLHLLEDGVRFLSVKGGIVENFYGRLMERISRARWNCLSTRFGQSI